MCKGIILVIMGVLTLYAGWLGEAGELGTLPPPDQCKRYNAAAWLNQFENDTASRTMVPLFVLFFMAGALGTVQLCCAQSALLERLELSA